MNTIGSIFDISIAESQALLIHGLEVIIVDLENVGKEEDGPAKEDNWRKDPSKLEQLEIGLNSLSKITCSSLSAWDSRSFTLRNW